MVHICPRCGGRMNRWRLPLVRRTDMMQKKNIIYKCLSCGYEQEFFE
ncbi:zinc ribbon domain-containing protein [Methanosalsum zhilinae]|nr:hypothetical protein [Methanosalsum zhilinae]